MPIYKVLLEKRYTILTLLAMGPFFSGSSLIGGRPKRLPLPNICLTYPAMMTLGRVIPYPKKIQKVYKSLNRPFEFC